MLGESAGGRPGTYRVRKPEVTQATVDEIVDLATSKCFDWAQDAIPETMAAVAAALTLNVVSLKHEIMEEDVSEAVLKAMMTTED